MSSTAVLGEQASLALRHSPIPALRRIRVEETAEAIILSGHVASYYYKQLAQETVLPILAGRTLRNQVRVGGRDLETPHPR